MTDNIVKISKASDVDEMLAWLEEHADETEELAVLRVSRDPDTGERIIEWNYTRSDSKIYTLGMLTYLQLRLFEAGDDT